ncbi:MAG: PEP-CTERM sorting domain-containing protein [Gemmatimonadaceae bacterium]
MNLLKSRRRIGQFSTAALLAAMTTTPVAAQTNTFNNGSLVNSPALTGFATLGNQMGGMLVTWTFATGGGGSGAWGDIGGGNWGVSSNGFSVSLGATTNSFANTWTLNNFTGGRLASVRFNGAPGRTLFDCDWNAGLFCNNSGNTSALEGTTGSANGYSLATIAGGSYTGAVVGAYSNRVGLAGSQPIGDLYEQLQINFSDTIASQGTYLFALDTDNSDFNQPPPIVTASPEPATYVLMGLGLLAMGVAKRRRRA